MPCSVAGCPFSPLIQHGTGCGRAFCALHTGAPLGDCPGCLQPFVYEVAA